MNTPQNDSSSISRRHFLKTTAVATGGLAGILSSSNTMAEAITSPGTHAHALGDATVRLALVGCGGRGSGAASNALSTEGGEVRLVAMADAYQNRLRGSLRNLSRNHEARIDVTPDSQFVGLDAYKAAIEMADVVVLATPPGFRPIHFEEAVRQGKHVFMEKPVAVDAPGVRRVLAAAQEARRKGLKVGVGLQRHHDTRYIETVKRLHDGAIGDIVSMRCYWNGNTPWVRTRASQTEQLGRPPTEMEYQVNNWYFFNWLCGDHIVEQHIHNIDVINWVKGAYPIRAQGMGGREVRNGPDFGEIFDHHFVEYEYADGTFLFSQCRHMPGTWTRVAEYVQGTRGSSDPNGLIQGANPYRFPRDAERRNPYQAEIDAFVDAVRNDKPFNEAENGAWSTMTAILGRLATYSGKMVEWKDAFNSDIDLMPKDFSWDAAPPVLPDENGIYPAAIPGQSVVV